MTPTINMAIRSRDLQVAVSSRSVSTVTDLGVTSQAVHTQRGSNIGVKMIEQNMRGSNARRLSPMPKHKLLQLTQTAGVPWKIQVTRNQFMRKPVTHTLV